MYNTKMSESQIVALDGTFCCFFFFSFSFYDGLDLSLSCEMLHSVWRNICEGNYDIHVQRRSVRDPNASPKEKTNLACT